MIDTPLDRMFEAFKINDKGLKCFFELEGETFWLAKSKGLFRYHNVARSVISYCERDRSGVTAGLYDHLVKQLTDITFHKTGENGEGVCLSDYEEVMNSLQKEDPLKAMNIHEDLPYGMAIACLGKPILARMMPEMLEISTLEGLGGNLAENSKVSQEKTASQRTSNKPAQGFTVEG